LTGKRRSRVQFKKELAVVTEFNEKMDLIEMNRNGASTIAAIESIVKDNFWASIEECSSPVGAMASLLDGQGSPAEIITSLFDFDTQGSWDSAPNGMDPPSILSFASNPSLLLWQNQKRIQSFSVPRRGRRRDPPSIML
jgi:hypothetical protein